MVADLFIGGAASAFHRGWRGVLTGAALLLLLSACATPEVDDGSGRSIDLPEKWDPIDIGEADLDLPLRSPFEITELRERVGAYQIFQNLYSFQDFSGYLVTSRVFVGQFSENASAEIDDLKDFLSFAEEQPIIRRRKLTLAPVKPFKHPDQHAVGYYTKATSELRHEDCLVLRIGTLLVEDSAAAREPEDIDTIVAGTLCSDRLDEAALLALLSRLEVVRNRDDFRKALSQRRIGTI